MKQTPNKRGTEPLVFGRRQFLATAVGACVIPSGVVVSAQVGASAPGALTKEERDGMTSGQVIEMLKKGNERFRAGAMSLHDYRAQQRSSAASQFPAAAVLGCIDSRAPAEIIFDAGIG